MRSFGLERLLTVVNMFRVITLVSLLALCHGSKRSNNFEAWLKDAVPLNSSGLDRSRIVGGQATTIDQHPYTVSLQHEWDEYQYDTIHFCTGGILDRNWIVTSGQCALLTELENVTVRVGSDYFHKDGTVYEIAEVVFHPLYNSNADDYDIAVLRLNDSLEFSDVAKRISLPKANVSVAEGTNFTMASWGASYFMGDMTTELQEITMPTISIELCSTVWGDRLTDRMFCAYQESEGMCIGDTGTPAVVDGVLIGIASFNYACAAAGYPTIYTDVSTVVDWLIEDIGISGSSRPTTTVSFYGLLAAVVVLVKMILE